MTFIVGILFGVTITYMLTYSSFIHTHIRVPAGGVRTFSGGFIPDSPHSHGETDDFRGPEQSVDWADKHSHSHTGTYEDILCLEEGVWDFRCDRDTGVFVPRRFEFR